jgi:hypothetical protein
MVISTEMPMRMAVTGEIDPDDYKMLAMAEELHNGTNGHGLSTHVHPRQALALPS